MPRPNVTMERKAQIIEAAVRVFSQQGFEAARMEDIATEAQLSIGGIYWYYHSKDEIVLSIVELVVTKDVHVLQELLAQPGSVQERLKHYLLADMETACQYLPLIYQIHGLAGRDETIRQKFCDYFASYRQSIMALIEQGMAQGELRPVNPELAATVLAGFYEGFSELVLFAPQEVNLERDLLGGLDLIFEGLVKADSNLIGFNEFLILD